MMQLIPLLCCDKPLLYITEQTVCHSTNCLLNDVQWRCSVQHKHWHGCMYHCWCWVVTLMFWSVTVRVDQMVLFKPCLTLLSACLMLGRCCQGLKRLCNRACGTFSGLLLWCKGWAWWMQLPLWNNCPSLLFSVVMTRLNSRQNLIVSGNCNCGITLHGMSLCWSKHARPDCCPFPETWSKILSWALLLQVLDFLKHAEANHTNPAVSKFFKLHCIKVHSIVGAAMIAGLALPSFLSIVLWCISVPDARSITDCCLCCCSRQR